MVGDSVRHDVDGALRVGMRAALVHRSDEAAPGCEDELSRDAASRCYGHCASCSTDSHNGKRTTQKRDNAETHEVDLALVGGPVRDALLARPSTDLDFTTSARPDATEAILKAWGSATWDMGRDFGTIGARRGGTTVEVTTCPGRRIRRADPQAGRGLRRLARRRPGAARPRVNAMALRLPDLTFVDPHGGLVDLDAGLLRTPRRRGVVR